MLALSYVYSSDEFADIPSIAMIEIDAGVAEMIMARRKLLLDLKAKASDLRGIQFWSGLVHWLGPDTEELVDLGIFTQEIADKILDNDVVLIEDLPSQPHESLFIDTEADSMFFTEDGVYWRAFPKHQDVAIETRVLGYNDIEPLLTKAAS